MGSSRDRSSDSLCERSMKLVTNIIRLSSFSLAKASLGPPSGRPKNHPPSRNGSVNLETEPGLSQFTGSRRSQEAQIDSKTISYLVELGETTGSACMIHEEKNVDGMASAYINKVHNKNRRHFHEDSDIILPPPPRVRAVK